MFVCVAEGKFCGTTTLTQECSCVCEDGGYRAWMADLVLWKTQCPWPVRRLSPSLPARHTFICLFLTSFQTLTCILNSSFSQFYYPCYFTVASMQTQDNSDEFSFATKGKWQFLRVNDANSGPELRRLQRKHYMTLCYLLHWFNLWSRHALKILLRQKDEEQENFRVDYRGNVESPTLIHRDLTHLHWFVWDYVSVILRDSNRAPPFWYNQPKMSYKLMFTF